MYSSAGTIWSRGGQFPNIKTIDKYFSALTVVTSTAAIFIQPGTVSKTIQ